MSLCPRRTLLVVAAILLVGCVAQPYFSKKRHGNLEVCVKVAERGPEAVYPEILVDGELLGNVTEDEPVLYLHEGEHEIEVRAPGFLPWHQCISISSFYSHQYVHVTLRRHPEVIGGPEMPAEEPAATAPEKAAAPPEGGVAPAAEKAAAPAEGGAAPAAEKGGASPPEKAAAPAPEKAAAPAPEKAAAPAPARPAEGPGIPVEQAPAAPAAPAGG